MNQDFRIVFVCVAIGTTLAATALAGNAGSLHKVEPLWVDGAPGVTQPGGRCSRPVSLLDIYPTLIELCDLMPKPEMEGTSLVPLLRNPKAKSKRAVVTTWLQNNHAVRSERWRYIRYKDGSEELYDHKNDPDEFVNLAGLKKYDSVKKELAAWIPKVNVTEHRASRKTK